jgi:alkylation response protein AidB-like acyl-CoA dehydrogenase
MADDKTAKLEAFRKEVRAWLRANLPKGWGTPEYIAPSSGSIEAHEQGKAWAKKLYEAGYNGFGYPKEYGGIVRPREEIAIIREEMGRTGTPGGPISLGLLLAAPTILEHGEEWQKKRYIPKILSGEESWCEGFSEPNAGSDLANVQTYAVRDGDDWVVKGQKVWTSAWHYADYCVLLVKTDLKAPRHRNLSCFILDCSSKGFSRRPLRQMSGEAEFGEMFFDDIRIPHKNMMGEENRGWYVAMTTLAAERSGGGAMGMLNMGIGTQRENMLGAESLIELAKNTKRYGKTVWDDPGYRQRIAQVAIEAEAARWWNVNFSARMRKGGVALTNEASVSKNFRSEMRTRRDDLAGEILGMYSQLGRGAKYAVDDGDWVYDLLRTRGGTIEMGTSEVNRNIIAERILGLPR